MQEGKQGGREGEREEGVGGGYGGEGAEGVASWKRGRRWYSYKRELDGEQGG